MTALADVPEGREAARGGALRAGGYLAGRLLTLGAVAVLFRHLGVEDTGRYVTVLSLVAVVGGLTDLGLTTLGLRELSTLPEGERRTMMADVLGLRLAATVVGVALVVGFAAAIGQGWEVVAGTALAGAGLVVQNAGTTLGMDLLVRLRAGRMALADLVRQASAALLVVGGVAAGASLIVFFALLVPAALAGFAVVAASTERVPPGRVAGRWLPLLRQTIPFAVGAAAGALFFRVAVVEMAVLSSERQTGLFGASFRVVEVLTVLPALAVSAAFPVFSRAAHGGEEERLASAVARTSQACAAVGGAVALVLALGAPAAIAVVAGGAFEEAVPVLRVQAAALFASFVAAPWGFALLSLGREWLLMWLNLGGLAIAVAVAAALIEADGARGGAVATVLGEGGLAVGFAIGLARVSARLRPSLAALARVLAAAGAGAAAALLPVPAAVQALVGVLAYAAALGALGGWPDLTVFRPRRAR